MKLKNSIVLGLLVACLSCDKDIDDAYNLPALSETEVVSIPVIFHVVHHGEIIGEGNNLSASVVQNILPEVNKHFRNRTGKSIDTQIEFRLADKKPDGTLLPERGIDRILYADSTAFNSSALYDEKIHPWVFQSMWDVNQYINVWVVTTTDEYSKGSYPYTTQNHSLEGLIEISSAQASQPMEYTCGIVLNKAHIHGDQAVLVHELGHYFGLFHVFRENDCARDVDYCADTYHYNRSLYNYRTDGYNRRACNGVSFISDNFMDYYTTYENRFTADQRKRMRHVAAFSPYVGKLRYSTQRQAQTENIAPLPRPEIIY